MADPSHFLIDDYSRRKLVPLSSLLYCILYLCPLHGISSARAFLRQRSDLPGSISQIVSDVNRQLTRDVGESGANEILTICFDTLSRFIEGRATEDDVTMIVIKIIDD